MSNPTRWVGIDLHRRRSQIAIIDEHGELTPAKADRYRSRDVHRAARRTRRGACGARSDLRLGVAGSKPPTDAGYDVHLTHPLRTRAIAAARVKTDAVDALHACSPAAHGHAPRGVHRSTRAA